MCGIAGLVHWAADGATLAAPIASTATDMAAALAHRGPDDLGVWTDPDGRCALSHRRLSVIDLPCGHQPLSNEDGSVFTVFNGEIYNYRTLRAELIAAGHSFRTTGDTEVLVHLWEQHGPAMTARLDGMFSFAVWDSRQKTLFAAVDPLGKKPFFYAATESSFSFGSELKALLAGGGIRKEVDAEAVLLYLHLGYVPAPWSILKSVRKLPPGHQLLARDGVVKVERYWRPVRTRPQKTISFADAQTAVRDRLTAAVQKRLIADVPLGAFLSGGVDSTLIVGLMSQLTGTRVKTFNIAFDEAAFDESRYARLVATRFGTDHHELTVRPDAIETLPTLAYYFDEPFGDSSAIATYYVARMTRQHVTVALTGDGGDEVFGGYRRYRRGKLAGWLRRVPGARAMTAAAGGLIPAGVDRTTDLGRARRVLRGFAAPHHAAYLEQMTIFPQPLLGELLSPSLKAAVDVRLPARWFASLYDTDAAQDPVAADMTADLQSYLPGDILTKVDRASMAVALECRCPFLDRQVVELALSLPTAWRLKGLAGHKWILRSAFADLLPPEVVHRRKAGFGVPLPDWFRGPLRSLLHDSLLSPNARSRAWVERAPIVQLIQEHEAGKNHATPLWTLLMLEMWLRRWGG